MLKLRIIPILSFNGFALVKTKGFQNPRMLGNPTQSARVYNARGVDELIFCDIYATKQNRTPPISMLKEILKECFMPVGVGGGIQTLEQISELLSVGADKVVIKASAIRNPQFINEAVRIFGAQCICVAVDVKRIDEKYVLFDIDNSQLPIEDFFNRMNDMGAGEYMVTSVLRDGTMSGFDFELAQLSRSLTNQPIIMAGGAGTPQHFVDLFTQAPIEAAAAASIFHFTQFTPLDIKTALALSNFPVRMQHSKVV
jgi:imidazole glycerol-phosphate synthase subunit HisF